MYFLSTTSALNHTTTPLLLEDWVSTYEVDVTSPKSVPNILSKTYNSMYVVSHCNMQALLYIWLCVWQYHKGAWAYYVQWSHSFCRLDGGGVKALQNKNRRVTGQGAAPVHIRSVRHNVETTWSFFMFLMCFHTWEPRSVSWILVTDTSSLRASLAAQSALSLPGIPLWLGKSIWATTHQKLQPCVFLHHAFLEGVLNNIPKMHPNVPWWNMPYLH